MNFDYSPEQEALRDSVRRFVEREYDWDSRIAILRSAAGGNPAHWATFAELGWLGAGLSEEQGGFGGGAEENALIAEELGRALVTEPFAPHIIATQLLAASGSDLAEELIGGMIMGEIRVAPALGEEAGRGDWTGIAARADGQGDTVSMTGVKTLVEGGAMADHFILSALSDQGVGLYLADARGPGITVAAYRTIDNRRVADVTLDAAPVKKLASGGAAQSAIELAMDHGIVAICGEALGAMDAALWATRDYLKTRKQFGTMIGNFQALQHRMADMVIETEMARSILFRALGEMAAGDPRQRTAAVSAAKAVFAQAALFVGSQAIQLHGAIGVTEELNISHFYRRLFVIARQFGDVDLHLERFASATDSLAAT